MHRFVVLAAGIMAISGISPADAASRHKHKVRPPVARSTPVVQPAYRQPSGLGRAATMLYR